MLELREILDLSKQLIESNYETRKIFKKLNLDKTQKLGVKFQKKWHHLIAFCDDHQFILKTLLKLQKKIGKRFSRNRFYQRNVLENEKIERWWNHEVFFLKEIFNLDYPEYCFLNNNKKKQKLFLQIKIEFIEADLIALGRSFIRETQFRRVPVLIPNLEDEEPFKHYKESKNDKENKTFSLVWSHLLPSDYVSRQQNLKSLGSIVVSFSLILFFLIKRTISISRIISLNTQYQRNIAMRRRIITSFLLKKKKKKKLI